MLLKIRRLFLLNVRELIKYVLSIYVKFRLGKYGNIQKYLHKVYIHNILWIANQLDPGLHVKMYYRANIFTNQKNVHMSRLYFFVFFFLFRKKKLKSLS